MPARLLLIGHTPSSNLERLAQALLQGARSAAPGLVLDAVPALQATADQVLQAQAVLLLTPENLGYMSGGMKDFFDRCYNPLLEHTQGLPYALVVRAGSDGTGTRRAIESICGGLRWKAVQPPLICRGPWCETFIDQCHELGQTLSAGLEAGIF